MKKAYLCAGMQKLPDIIQHYEQQLTNAKSESITETHYTLARLYNFVDAVKVDYHVAKVLELTAQDPLNTTRLNARLSFSRALTSNRKIQQANKEVEDVVQLALTKGNKQLHHTALIYKLFLCPFGNETTLGNELIATLSESPYIKQDLALQCNYHLAVADFLREQDLQAATNELYKALECSKQDNKPWVTGTILCKLGINADTIADVAAAEKYYGEALPLLTEHECTQYIFQVNICYSKLRITEKKYEEAIHFAEIALEVAKSINFQSGVDFAFNHKITALLWMKKIDEAEKLTNEIISTTNNNLTKGLNYNILSNISVQKGDIEKAIEYTKIGYDLRKEVFRPQDELTVNDKLYKLYKRIGKFDEALQYLELVHNKKVELMDEAKIKAVTEMQAKYEDEKKEAEIKKSKLLQIESELKAIKAQMNPHFIFNALNSIQEIFFLGDKRLANKHLARFSVLMRNILKASGRKSITLQEEMEMLQEYLALEALRFGNNFTFTVTADEDTDTYTLDVPPMILQPFAENAVKHGLLHKEREQRIKIHFSFNEEQQCILATVTDNGIGRKASAIINQHRQGHQSFATSAIEKRFEILNSNAIRKFSFAYTDLNDKNNNISGTRVEIILPIEE